MIDIKQLRIGNIISLRGAWHEVTGVKANIIFSKPHGQTDTGFYEMSDCYEAVELTTIILGRAGFDYDEDKSTYSIRVGIYNKENLVIEWRQVKAHWLRTVRGERVSFWKDLLYLHDLQNLFNSLTGEELNILCLQANIN